MPLYSDLGLYGTPSSSSYSGLYLPSPYSNHSSILAANYRSPVLPKPLPRSFARGYKPHLATITESQAINPIRRKFSPTLLLQHHGSPKYKVQKPININTADIDVSVNKYRKYDRKTAPPEVKKSPEKSKSPSPSSNSSSATEKSDDDKQSSDEKPAIRRDRALVRLHTVHKKDSPRRNLQNGDVPKSWRETIYADEPKAEERRSPRRTPGELLVDKFLIRTKDEEERLRSEGRMLPHKESVVRKNKPKESNFHKICRAISSETINENLNPGQPDDIVRMQSKQIDDDLLNKIRRNSSEILQDNVMILEDMINEELSMEGDENNNEKRKKKAVKKKSNEKLTLDHDTKSTLHRRPTQKKIRRTSTDSSLHSDVDDETEKAYQEAIRDISQVEVEEIKLNPKHKITATVDVDEIPALKAVIEDVEIVESPTYKKPKKFRFNVTVEEVENKRNSLERDDVMDLPQTKLNVKNSAMALKREKSKSPTPDETKSNEGHMKRIEELSKKNENAESPKKMEVQKKEVESPKTPKITDLAKAPLTPKIQKPLEVKTTAVSKLQNIKIDSPKTPLTVEISDGKGLLENNSEAPKNSTPKQPETPKRQQTPKLTEVSKNTETPETPKLTEITKKLPETPQKPQTPQTPKLPDPLQKPLTPKLPETPQKPQTPKLPETQQQKPQTPQTPKLPETPQKTQTPKLPETPQQKQQTPQTPKLPNTPETPKKPFAPKLPESPLSNAKPVADIKKSPESSPKTPDSPKSPASPKIGGARKLVPKLAPKEENNSGENFWEKIATRESVYLDLRRRKLQEKRYAALIQEEDDEVEPEKAKGNDEESKTPKLQEKINKKMDTTKLKDEKRAEIVKSPFGVQDKDEKKAEKVKSPLGLQEKDEKKVETTKFPFGLIEQEDAKIKSPLSLQGKEEMDEMKVETVKYPFGIQKKDEIKAEKVKSPLGLQEKDVRKVEITKFPFEFQEKGEQKDAKIKSPLGLQRREDKKPEIVEDKKDSGLTKSITDGKLGDLPIDNSKIQAVGEKKVETPKTTPLLEKDETKVETTKITPLLGKDDKKVETLKTAPLPGKDEKKVQTSKTTPLPGKDEKKIETPKATPLLAKDEKKIETLKTAPLLGTDEKKVETPLLAKDEKKIETLKTAPLLGTDEKKVETPKTTPLPEKEKNRVETPKTTLLHGKDENKVETLKTAPLLGKDEKKVDTPKTTPLLGKDEKKIETPKVPVKDEKKPETPKTPLGEKEIEIPKSPLGEGEVKKTPVEEKKMEVGKLQAKDELKSPKLLNTDGKNAEFGKSAVETNQAKSAGENKPEGKDEKKAEATKFPLGPQGKDEKKLETGKSPIAKKAEYPGVKDEKKVEAGNSGVHKLQVKNEKKVETGKIQDEKKTETCKETVAKKLPIGKGNDDKEKDEKKTVVPKTKAVEDNKKGADDPGNNPVKPKLKKEKSEEKKVEVAQMKVTDVPSQAQNADVKTNEEEEEKKKKLEEEEETKKKLISKRSLVNKSGVEDPDLKVFAVPKEPTPPPAPEPSPPSFVPLQSNRITQWMHPFKKPEQFEQCPVQRYARPKTIRHRYYPRPRVPVVAENESSGEEEEDEDEEEEDDDDEEEETSEESGSEEETSEESIDYEDLNDVWGYGKVGASTSSDDSGFDSSTLDNRKNKECDVNCHRKCEKLTANLCGVNQKLIVEAIESVKKGCSERDSPTSNPAHNPAFALDPAEIAEEFSQSSTFAGFQKSGRITPPATTIPRFRKYNIEDFNFLKVLGKGSFGKVLLAELKDTEYYYAIKCLKKDVVLEDDDVECTLIERKVLALGTKHPYLCHLLCTFQTESHLFFVMEYLNGGDLMFHIQKSGRFPEPRARFYAAEIVSGLKFLHSKGIVYRDLKLDNILLDFDGHVRIADFGMCKLQIFLDRTADTFCGTPDYMAPEIIKGQHYNQNVDWWSFGVLLYEMLIGQSPFSGCDEDELFWSICNEIPRLPKFLSKEASSILTLLLEKDATKRLGNKFCHQGDIMEQPFFHPVDWEMLNLRKMEPPFKPCLQHPLDTQYFDRTFTVEKAKLTPIEQDILQSMDQAQFQGFSYTNPNATDR